MVKRISVTNTFISDTRSLIDTFGAVRYYSLVRYLETMLGVSVQTAEEIADNMLQQRFLIKAQYSGTSIVKTSKAETANYDRLDAFEAFLFILDEEKRKDDRSEVYARKVGLPADFEFSTSSGLIYDVVINNDRGPQKIRLLEKEKEKYKDQILLLVFTSGTDLSQVSPPALSGRYRIAVVRRSESGRATCKAGGIEGKNE